MIYEDNRGWTYEVYHGLTGKFKAWVSKPDSSKHHYVGTLPWRETYEEAEVDLKLYAEKHKMEELEPEDGTCGTCRWRVGGRCRNTDSPNCTPKIRFDFDSCGFWEAKE